MNEEELFAAARQKSPTERAAFLRKACGTDFALRADIEELLLADDQADSLLDNPVNAAAIATVDIPVVTEKPGTQIGPYKLLQQIGEGGFGVVYMAEQHKPVRRKVALKIIKPGMDTREVIARFEAERQALALMDHPNIAKVLDAGATESGRPYFVMELVKGVPITEFCDEQKLSTHERLQLFVDICRAIQHAHQKGIIHRDLKPTNVMVTLDDHRPIPKVIDFGISKALSQQLTEKTLFTAYGQMIGTPLYMAPEQAQMSMRDVDTRSDVYSLGVVLYELLTGTTPFDKETLQKSGFEEMRRIICEVEPPRPSARISTLNAEALSTVSDKRKVDGRKLSQSLRGELDWIVMKALEKDRSRRYESASAFAADVERYLNDEPVQACPPSLRYRVGKWARKNRTAAAIICLACLLFAVVAASGFVLAEHARETAEREKQIAVRRADINRKLAAALATLDQANERLSQTGFVSAKAWADVEKSAERVRTLSDSELADAELADQAEAHFKRIRHAEHRRGFLKKLARLRTRTSRTSAASARTRIDIHAREVATSGHRAAFAEIGIDPAKTSPEKAATLIAAEHDIVRQAAIGGLSDWSKHYLAHNNIVLTVEQKQEQKWAEQVLDLADNDPWRRQLRKAARNQDFQTLFELSKSPAVDGQPPSAVLSLAAEFFDWTSDHRMRYGVEILKRALHKYPGDYSLSRTLAVYLTKLKDPESVSYATVAVGLRPDDAETLLIWGDALAVAGRYDQAADAYRRVLNKSDMLMSHSGSDDYMVGSPHGHHFFLIPSSFTPPAIRLSEVLQKAGRTHEAHNILKSALTSSQGDPQFFTDLGKALSKAEMHADAQIAYHKARRLSLRLAKSDSSRYTLYNNSLGPIVSYLVKKGQVDEALALLKEANTEFTDISLDLRFHWQGKLLIEAGQWKQAATYYEQALPQIVNVERISQIEYRIQLIRAYAALQQTEKALAVVTTIVQRIPKKIERIGRGIFGYSIGFHSFTDVQSAALSAERRKKIGATVRAVFAQLGSTAENNNALGHVLFNLGDREGATTAYRKAVELDPQSAIYHYNLAFCLRDRKDKKKTAEALAHYAAAAKLRKPYQRIYLGVSCLKATREWIASKKYDSPTGLFVYGVADSSPAASAGLQTGDIILAFDGKRTTDPFEFGKRVRNATTSSPVTLAVWRNGTRLELKVLLKTHTFDDPAFWVHYARCLKTAERYDEAIEAYKKALAQEKYLEARADGRAGEFHEWHWSVSSLWFEYGVCLLNEKRHQEAITVLQKYLKSRPTSVPGQVMLALEYTQARQPLKSIEAWRNVIRLSPENAKAHYNLGVALLPKNRHGAIVCFRRAIALNPRFAEAWSQLGHAFMRLHDYSSAAGSFEKAIEFSSDGGGPHINLGLMLRKLGRSQEALKAFEKGLKYNREFLQKNPDDGRTRHNVFLSLVHLARELSDSREPTLRDAARAVTLARQATQMQPKNALGWIALGEACYRNGEYSDCIAALIKAPRLKKTRSYAVKLRLFLAMANWQLGKKSVAHKQYAFAEGLIKKGLSLDGDLRTLREETRKLLAVTAEQN